MAELYGTPAAIKGLLQSVDGQSFETIEDTRITNVQKMASILIEQRTGRVFGDATPPSETLVVEGAGSPTLFLPKGIRTLASITQNPEWNGSAWVNGTALTLTDYRLAGLTTQGAYRTIQPAGAYWPSLYWNGPYVIVGVWEDQVPPPVPDEITHIANYIAAELYKEEGASPAGFIGTDGAVVPIRKVMESQRVKPILEHYRLNAGTWFF